MKSSESVNELSKNIIDRKERCRAFYNAEITEKVIAGNNDWRIV